MVFANRRSAGQQLARALSNYRDEHPVVYAIPRGGVMVAAPVAEYLKADLDVIIVRKIAYPMAREYAVGATNEAGDLVMSERQTNAADVQWLTRQVALARHAAKRKRACYLKVTPKAHVGGRIAIIVDDGMATGCSLRAALKEIRRARPAEIVVAVPVASPEAVSLLRAENVRIIALEVPTDFTAVSQSYQDFYEVSDQEVESVLRYIAHIADPNARRPDSFRAAWHYGGAGLAGNFYESLPPD